MTSQWKLESPSEAITEKRRDRGFVHVLDRCQHPEALIEDRFDSAARCRARSELLEIHTDRKILVTDRRQDQDTNLGILRRRNHGFLECIHVFQTHPIDRRIIDRQGEHATVSLDEKG